MKEKECAKQFSHELILPLQADSVAATPNKSSAANRGEIFLQLHLFSNEGQNRDRVVIAHRRLLKVLLSYELIRRDPRPYSWRDDFAPESLSLLAQHAVQGRMSRDDTALTRWSVYSRIHSTLPLDHRVFTPILDKLRKLNVLLNASGNSVAAEGEIESDPMKDFHSAATEFANQCVNFVRKHRMNSRRGNEAEEECRRNQLEHALNCLHIIHCLR